jgi:single-strand selective monofunctional uracil DNA glycosylase
MALTRNSTDSDFTERLLAAGAVLRDEMDTLDFADPVAHVYNPLRYAWPMHEAFVRRFGTGPRRVLLLGMNPGPWGMVQTGIPFGEVAVVKEWMGLNEPIDRPAGEHPKRPIQGLDCRRSEVSGRRLWGYFAERFGTPEKFFREHFVLNYCPLAFLEEGGRNRTPDKLPAAETVPLFRACDDHLIRVVELFQPEWLVGVGAFAQKKLKSLFASAKEEASGPRIGVILHPSPASPAANRGWAEAAERQFLDQGIWS